MLVISIPGRGTLRLQYLVLDLNGTLTVDGVLINGIAERLMKLREQLSLHLITADTRGTAARSADELQVTLRRIEPRQEAEGKRALVMELGQAEVAAIGNGANDAGMLEAAALGIAVAGPEGLATAALRAADIVAPGINEALDLLLILDRLIATLRC